MSEDKRIIRPERTVETPNNERGSTQKTYTTSHLEDKLNNGGSSDKTEKKDS